MSVKEAYIRERVGKGFLVKLFNVNVPQGHRIWREHRHSQFEIVLIKDGSGIYSMCGKSYTINKGDVFIFSSNEIHCITQINEGGMQIMNLHIEPRFFWGDETERFTDYNLLFSHSPDFENRIERGSELQNKISRLLLEAEEEFENNLPEYRMMVRAKLIEILTSLVRSGKYQQKNETAAKSMTAISEAVEYIHKGLTCELRLCDIADAAGMSASYFSNVFKTVMGITLWDYITEKRIDIAMRLLDKNTDYTMLEIALDSGFNNTANFNKAFKKHTGLTPSEYKQHGKSMLY